MTKFRVYFKLFDNKSNAKESDTLEITSDTPQEAHDIAKAHLADTIFLISKVKHIKG